MPITGVGSSVVFVEAQSVDPRDIGIEWDATIYRVYFWSADGGRCTEFELTRVDDLHEVLSWAKANSNGRVAEIFVRHDHDPERGLIRLAGRRPGLV